jgi:pseudouridylate synthase I
MRRIKLTVAYDGTAYHGWQIQINALTIEAVLKKALKDLLNEEIEVIGASRTDSGVHALGNIAVFDTNAKISADKFAPALNVRLPKDIVIIKSEETVLDYHPRKCNTIKTYEYLILNAKVKNPLKRLDTYFFFRPLNIDDMKMAATYLIGEHDFASFCSSGSQVDDTVRRIYDLSVTKDEDEVKISISGDGFLYNMVRIIVGTLINVGIGKYSSEYVYEILKEEDRKKAGKKSPAEGLKLVSIEEVPRMPCVLDIVSEKFSYIINNYYSDTIMEEHKIVSLDSFITLRKCSKAEFLKTIKRLLKKCFRNNARKVFIYFEKAVILEQYNNLLCENSDIINIKEKLIVNGYRFEEHENGIFEVFDEFYHKDIEM